MASPSPRSPHSGLVFWVLITLLCGVAFIMFRDHIFPEEGPLAIDPKVESTVPAEQVDPLNQNEYSEEQPVVSTDQGLVHLQTTPAGVSVVLDGKTIGVTPLSLKGGAPGPHELSLRLSCYRPVQHEFVLGEDDLNLSFDLELICGDLEVVSTPPGAVVSVNGKKRGRTPYVMTGVRTGEHKLLVRNGFADQSRILSIRFDRDGICLGPGGLFCHGQSGK